MITISEYIDLSFKPKLALGIAFGFMVFTIIGTLSHEIGHIAVAKIFGFETILHYGSMNYDQVDLPEDIKLIAQDFKKEIAEDLNFPKRKRWELVKEKRNHQRVWIRAGGPLQTILTGTLGLFLLYRRRIRILKNGVKLVDWVYVFLALFWLRPLSNLVQAIFRDLFRGGFSPFSGRSDELFIARNLDWWEGSISLPLGLIALGVALYVIFKILPKPLRFTFIQSGLIGGVFGYFFWLEWIGPIVLP